LLGLRDLVGVVGRGAELAQSVLPTETPGEPVQSLATLVAGGALVVKSGRIHETLPNTLLTLTLE
jgi:hypothetical protein